MVWARLFLIAAYACTTTTAFSLPNFLVEGMQRRAGFRGPELPAGAVVATAMPSAGISDVPPPDVSPATEQVKGMICKNGVCIMPPETQSYTGDWVSEETRQYGICTHWNEQKGFGFITIVHPGPKQAATAFSQRKNRNLGISDVFVHQSDIHARGFRSLAIGERVEFIMAHNERNGKHKAAEVTGPGGQYVRGASAAYENDFDDIFDDVFDA